MRSIACLLLAACSTAPHLDPFPLATARPVTAESAFAPPVLGALMSMVDALPVAAPWVRELHGPTACRTTDGVNPYVVPGLPGPVVGQPWECRFSTTACAPYPASDAWLIVSTRPMPSPIDFTPYGMPGCWALVNPDMVVSVPASGSTGMVMRERGDGRILFRWTPAQGMQGQSMFFQLLVARPGQTPSGWVASHGIEVLVGS